MRRAVEEPDMRGMGTTVTLALLRGSSVMVAHVGDSRAYLVSAYDRAIQQITSDHSFVEALLAAGHITPEQAEEHPMRNVLYRALGQSEDMDVDVYQARLRHGDWLVLCSDGLTRHVRAHEIARIALNAAGPEDASEQLIALANQRGGEDNVSVIAIQAEGDPSASDDDDVREQFLPDEEDAETDTIRIPDLSGLRADSPPEADPDAAPPADTDPALRHKMSAERLSDNDSEPDDPAAPDPLDRVLAVRPPEMARLRRRVPTHSPPQPFDGDSEGQDTRIPDQ
jgi:hypothetical protein